MSGARERQARLRRHWDRQAAGYDKAMGFLDRHLFGDTRTWVCSRAEGEVLEVAVGTGLNLPFYPDGVRLTGVEWSPAMLEVARDRARRLRLDPALRLGDAQSLDLPDSSFDTVVCTFSLCAIPDEHRALAEMDRVLRPGGRLLLADHVVSSRWYVRALQAATELASVPLGGEHFRRRPFLRVQALGYEIEEHERFKLGIVERLAARKLR